MADIREIADFSAPELDIFARLRDSQLANWECAEQGVFIAESPKVIARALQSGYEPISFLMERRHVENQAKPLLERCPEVPVFTAEEPVLAQMTGFHLTRGMLCAMKRRTLPRVEQVCANARRVAVLERVMNPTNVGAIFRSAAALGMDAVLLSGFASVKPGEKALDLGTGTGIIPILLEETDKIMKAQIARGADMESGNLIQKAKAMIPILVPLFVSAFRRANDLAMAMEARCYRGGNGRTKMKPLIYKSADHMAYLITILYVVIAFVVGRYVPFKLWIF